jgi:pantoate--beta-alanine ligase
MEIISDPKLLQSALYSLSTQSKQSIGFVPTMGALHSGHKSLIERSVKENDITVVSIFVNPTQFLQGEDLDKYPKKFDADKRICELSHVDYLFFPNAADIYTHDEILIKAPKYKGFILEGERRAGHFDGMLQIVLKLFNIISPTNAYFGKKDAQQLVLIQQMVQNLFLDINVVPCDIVREENGLALSSRNSYLDATQKMKSLAISKALKLGARAIGNGELQSSAVKSIIETTLIENDIQTIDYIEVVNREFQQIEQIELKNTILLVAVKIETTRLIDNLWV